MPKKKFGEAFGIIRCGNCNEDVWPSGNLEECKPLLIRIGKKNRGKFSEVSFNPAILCKKCQSVTKDEKALEDIKAKLSKKYVEHYGE